MRYHELAQEAESRTKEAKYINSTLTNAGYKRLGTGTDATVWMKDEGTVIKIIMPENYSGSTHAANIFRKFYEFVVKNQQYENLPRFVEIGGQHHTKFKIGNKEYIQAAMEQLYPIASYGTEGDIVNIFSDSTSNKDSWEVVKQKVSDAEYLKKSGSRQPLKTSQYIKSLNQTELAKLQVLYQLMTVLYHTGKINKFGWDLHVGNVMKRENGTLVITDPWFEYMGSK